MDKFREPDLTRDAALAVAGIAYDLAREWMEKDGVPSAEDCVERVRNCTQDVVEYVFYEAGEADKLTQSIIRAISSIYELQARLRVDARAGRAQQ